MKIKNNVCDYYSGKNVENLKCKLVGCEVNGDKVLVKLEDGSEVIVKSNEVKW
jgi:hypothetical protein